MSNRSHTLLLQSVIATEEKRPIIASYFGTIVNRRYKPKTVKYLPAANWPAGQRDILVSIGSLFSSLLSSGLCLFYPRLVTEKQPRKYVSITRRTEEGNRETNRICVTIIQKVKKRLKVQSPQLDLHSLNSAERVSVYTHDVQYNVPTVRTHHRSINPLIPNGPFQNNLM